MTENIFAALRDRVLAALAEALPDLPPDALSRVEVTPPKDSSHGDMMTNAALVVAKPAKLPPPKVAALLVERLRAAPEVESAEPAGPGFINLRLRAEALRALLPVILCRGESYGDGTTGQGVRIDVEYVSANPTGPMHVGHCRGAVVGDALANLLAKAGYAVTKEYYINDAGAQVEALAWAAYWRYLKSVAVAGSQKHEILTFLRQAASEEVEREAIHFFFNVVVQYSGSYLIPVGSSLFERFGDALVPEAGNEPSDAVMQQVQEIAVAAMMEMIREDLVALGVRHDVFISERELVVSGAVERAFAQLEADGLIYTGVLDPPKGKTPDDWEPRPQLLFAATRFGDDVDRPLRKSDGSNTYFANDIANHADKIARGHDALVHVWGADHAGYVPRMKAAVAALSGGRVPLDIVLCQIVKVIKGGEVVRMSKRAGSYVTLRDLIDEVGADAVRFTMLTRKSDAQFDFDLDAVVAQTKDNPVFYVQYAHARCRSVLRAATAAYGADVIADSALAEADLAPLSDPAELALIRRLATWPRVIESAALAKEPHRIAFFLSDLAADFHALWNRGREDAALRFIQEADRGGTLARLALVAATAVTLRSGLAVMGVSPVEEMR